jgi:glycosyltransferase involved in cell wall biosynthesis
MYKIEHISCVIIAKDAEKTIQETLESLTHFKEVILYLNNSTDTTKIIAQKYPNVTIIEGDFIGFGPTKNMACSFATNDWILSLDSDEVLLPKLHTEMQQLNLQNENEVFIIKRDNYFLNKKVRFSGWGNDYLTRIYNKKKHQFNQNQVHEFIEPTSHTYQTTLKNSFKHNAVQNINQFLFKIIHYSDLASQNKKTCCFLTVIAKAKWAFFKTYVLQLGFLDGWRGFVIALSNFNGKFFRYTKRYINCKKP